MAKFDIKTVKPKFVVTTSPENKIDVVVNKPIIETKLSKSFFKLKNTGGPVGPRGPQGERGPEGLPGRDGRDGVDGQDGQAATIEVASTSTLPAGSAATVTNVGSASQARLAFGIPKGDTGAAGADGDAATIQVGQVETLQPNQQAYVQNVGTTSAAIFNIGIPKGDKGDSGSGSGDMTASVYDPNGTVAAAGGIPDYVDSNGGKIDTIKVNGTAQTITDKTVDLSVPTKTSDITNDSGYVTSTDYATNATGGVIKTTGAFGVDMSNSGEIKGAIVSSADYSTMWNDAFVSKGTLENALSTKGYATTSSLATVATSGSYNDLSNKPTIPTVNDATLTIQHNGTNVQTFTANQGTNATANIETIWADDAIPATSVPPVTSDLIDWASIDYSEPFQIGTWVNGKALYRKVVSVGTLPNASTKNVNIGVNAANVVNLSGFAYQSSVNRTFMLPFLSDNTSTFITLVSQGDNVTINTYSADRSGFTTAYVYVDYWVS